MTLPASQGRAPPGFTPSPPPGPLCFPVMAHRLGVLVLALLAGCAGPERAPDPVIGPGTVIGPETAYDPEGVIRVREHENFARLAMQGQDAIDDLDLAKRNSVYILQVITDWLNRRCDGLHDLAAKVRLVYGELPALATRGREPGEDAKAVALCKAVYLSRQHVLVRQAALAAIFDQHFELRVDGAGCVVRDYQRDHQDQCTCRRFDPAQVAAARIDILREFLERDQGRHFNYLLTSLLLYCHPLPEPEMKEIEIAPSIAAYYKRGGSLVEPLELLLSVRPASDALPAVEAACAAIPVRAGSGVARVAGYRLIAWLAESRLKSDRAWAFLKELHDACAPSRDESDMRYCAEYQRARFAAGR